MLPRCFIGALKGEDSPSLICFLSYFSAIAYTVNFRGQDPQGHHGTGAVEQLQFRNNIVGQKLPTLLDVTCCVHLHTLLLVFACCWAGSSCAKFENGKTFKPTTPNISCVPWWLKLSAAMLDPFAQLFHQGWGLLGAFHMIYELLWVVSFPRCTPMSQHF